MATHAASLSPTAVASTGWRLLLTKASLYTALLGAALALALAWAPISQPRMYFFEQDIVLLSIVTLGLLMLTQIRIGDRGLAGDNARLRYVMTAAAVLFAYAGSHWLIGSYSVSRDEQLADFAGHYLRNGWLGWPIEPALRPFAKAAMPLWAENFNQGHFWVSGYLPVNSAIRACFLSLGDARLAGPALLVVGTSATLSASRRIWPDRSYGGLIALVLILSAPQLLANAMTSYAMTALFALNAVWLACFLRGSVRGHAAAATIGLFATGLHQVQFHILFVAGFIIWLWWQDRRYLATFYVAACLAYLLVWLVLYPHVLVGALGYQPQGMIMPIETRILAKFARLREFEPGTSLARFIAWQNVLLSPFFVVGAGHAFKSSGRHSVLCALALSCSIGLATMVFQGHGYGYRYLHGLIPAFCLVAAGGWLTIEQETKSQLPAGLLWGGTAITLSVAMPFALWKSDRFDVPYAAAYRAVKTASTDVVLVDSRAGAWVQDIVRVDPDHPQPLLLELAYVSAVDLRRLCATRRVMTFGSREARALGIRAPLWNLEEDDLSEARARQLVQLRCGVPVPLGRYKPTST